jgi:hypothetical protein
LPDLDGQALPTKIIDYRKRPETLPIKQAIGGKIHAPTLIYIGCQRQLDPVGGADSPFGSF